MAPTPRRASAPESGTAAVAAGGLDAVYPPEYRDLHERVVRDGVVVLEMPPARGRQPATSRDATASLSG